MQWTGLNELREKFLSFFESKGHLRLESFSLIPQGDKSLLLINSGMAPMKKYFTGEVTPPRNRVTTCQKCIRTPDIESVGKTARHGTYFEMLGNFSFGDYFKKEATAWAWEFFTKVLELPEDKLYCSIYEEDDEAFEIWTKGVGVDPSHIKRLGKADNFWEHGAGPCGPCSEIYYDRGEKYGCGSPDCGVGCDCDRFMEVWNLVFTQFSNDGEGNYSKLDRCNIDTGMGLERLACVMQGVDNLFEVDTVQNIMKHIMQIAGIKYHEDPKSDVSLRVITDHIRSTTFMIGDGVMPSNEGKGYVLRRLLRRAARHGRLIGINEPFLSEVCKTVIKENAQAYPNLVEKADYIQKIIKVEEENFNKTIDSGTQLLADMIANADGKVLSGADAFKLSDTYGFPIDLTREILEEKGMSVDEEAFNALVLEQRKRSRDARKDAGAEAWKDGGLDMSGIEKTNFVGYTDFETDAKIIALYADNERKEFIENGQEASVILDTTSFYAESGGQAGDSGEIILGDTVFEVSDTIKVADAIFVHNGFLRDGEGLKVGDEVKAVIDSEKRKSTMRNHTAAHLLQAALRQVLGNHVEQAGQFVNEKEVRFDFTHFSAMSAEEIKTVENIVNEEILKSAQVTMTEMPIEEAKKLGAMALFGEKYGDIVRVVKAGDISVEFCGGTHVSNTSKLGLFKILSESSVASGVRRIEAVTGKGVLELIENNTAVLYGVAKAMKMDNVGGIEKRAASLMNEVRMKDKEIEKLSGELSAIKAASMSDSAETAGQFKFVSGVFENVPSEELRTMCDKAKQSDEAVVMIVASKNTEKQTVSFAVACTPSAVKLGANAGNIVREAAKTAGGNGGGRPDTAMAGGKDVTKTDDAIAKAKEIVASI